MQKRGSLIYKGLIVTIAIGIVILIYTEAGASFGSQRAFYKLAVAKDIALLIDSLYAMPGDVKTAYDKDLSKYAIVVNANVVKVYETNLGIADITSAQYKFFGHEISNVKVENPKHLIITKTNDKITLSRE